MRIIKKEEIKNLIGETTDYDKKLMLEEKDTRSWLKSVSAFANGIGGTLIYGIEDKTDELVGLADAKKDADKISRFIRDRMDPVPVFELRFASIDGVQLILVEVPDPKTSQETPSEAAKDTSPQATKDTQGKVSALKGADLEITRTPSLIRMIKELN